MNVTTDGPRFPVLDGWRGFSILLVLAGHLLPLGPKQFELNLAVAAMGMAIFFTLSGFLITTFLLRRPDIKVFLIRRFFRIIPLAWACCALVLLMAGSDRQVWMAHILFYGNLPPFLLLDATAHFWSLCLEVQFYVGVALLIAILGIRALYVLPFLCLLSTAGRVAFHEPMTILTWFRIDEILAGAILALLVHSRRYGRLTQLIGRMPPVVLIGCLLAASHPKVEPLNYLRPYIASAAVGATIFNPHSPWADAMRGRILGYVAQISYALYVLHPLLAHTWLGTGDAVHRYLKRPLLFITLVWSAHVSTFKFENVFIGLGHRLSDSLRREPA